jgi:hypothetical protein
VLFSGLWAQPASSRQFPWSAILDLDLCILKLFSDRPLEFQARSTAVISHGDDMSRQRGWSRRVRFTTKMGCCHSVSSRYCEEEQHPATRQRDALARPLYVERRYIQSGTIIKPLVVTRDSVSNNPGVTCQTVGSSKDVHTPIIDTKGQDKGIQIAKAERDKPTNSFVISL